jgi:hypothetical protein
MVTFSSCLNELERDHKIMGAPLKCYLELFTYIKGNADQANCLLYISDTCNLL